MSNDDIPEWAMDMAERFCMRFEKTASKPILREPLAWLLVEAASREEPAGGDIPRWAECQGHELWRAARAATYCGDDGNEVSRSIARALASADREATERAARVCEEKADALALGSKDQENGARDCAAAIRKGTR